MLRATAKRPFLDIWIYKKWFEPVSFFKLLTCKCPSRHSRVPFLEIVTSKIAPNPWFFLAFWLARHVLRATAACHVWTSELQKLLRACDVLGIFTCKCASRHSGVPFLDIGTSKIGPCMWSFKHLYLKMCLAPQRRAIFHFFAEHLPPHLPL